MGKARRGDRGRRDRDDGPARRWLLLLAVGILLAGCDEQSRVDADARVEVSGTVRGVDAAAMADLPVRLGTGVGFGDGALGAVTLGAACLDGDRCRGDTFVVRTGADGAFAFDLDGSDTQSSFGEALSTLVSAAADPGPDEVSGPAVSARFRIQTERLALPDLTMVDPVLRIDAGSVISTSWSSPAPGPFDLRFESSDPVPVWQLSTTDSAAPIDPRVLEGTAGRVVLSGRSDRVIEGSDVELRWRSGGRPYSSRLGAPASRGRSCRLVQPEGEMRSAAGPSCELTDGVLGVEAGVSLACGQDTASDASDPGSPSGVEACASPAAVIIDLGGPVTADLVVVRGCVGGCAIEVTTDGQTFRPVGAATDGFGTIELSGEPITAVRVGLGAGRGLREVSVWEPLADDAELALDRTTADELRSRFDADPDADAGSGSPSWLVVAAIASIAVVLIVVGFVIGRRRSSLP